MIWLRSVGWLMRMGVALAMLNETVEEKVVAFGKVASVYLVDFDVVGCGFAGLANNSYGSSSAR